MTDTNNKETFESKITFLGKSISKGRYVSEIDLYDLKQLHDKEINRLKDSQEILLVAWQNDVNKLEEKNKQISELQTEVERFYEGLIWMKKNQYKKK